MSTSDLLFNLASDKTPLPHTYTPGYAKCKLLMVLYGVILFSIGFWQLWIPLDLIVFGKATKAEVIAVIKTKAGLPDLLLKDEFQLQAKIETHDRSYVFWNQFSFHTDDGRIIEVRAPVGSKLKPLYTLIDADGLPTYDLVYYNPQHPQSTTFPLIVSTWFLPGVLIIVGLVSILVGATLYHWANKPIDLPHLPSEKIQG